MRIASYQKDYNLWLSWGRSNFSLCGLFLFVLKPFMFFIVGCESGGTHYTSNSTVCFKFYSSKKTWNEHSKNYSNEVYTYHESCALSMKNVDKQKTILILCLSIPSLMILFFSVMLVIFMKKGLICRENKNIISHKNDLYGNLTNEDYVDQRYDTNITDRNQYYEGEGEQYAEYIAW